MLFDDVHVGGDRLLGNEGDGWAIAMYLLQWERGMYPWQRQAALLTALDRLLADHADRLDPGELADAYLAVLPMRVSSRNTIWRLVAGENPGPEVSVDKVLLARAEVAVHDLADAVLAPAIELGDDRKPKVGATTTSSAGRRRSTEARSRSSGRSSPTACSACREADTMVALDQETLDLFRRTVRSVFDVRRRRPHRALEDVGWRDILTTDARGRAARVPPAGRAPARSAMLDDVAVEAMEPGSPEWLDELGQLVRAPGTEKRGGGRVDGDDLVVDGLALREPRDGRIALLVDETGTACDSRPRPRAVERTDIHGMDPTLGLVRVTGRSAPARSSSPTSPRRGGAPSAGVPRSRTSSSAPGRRCST